MLAAASAPHHHAANISGSSSKLHEAARQAQPVRLLTRCLAYVQQQQQQQQQQCQPAAALAAGLAAGVLLLSGSPAHAGVVLEGRARVVDGDTLYIGQEKIRLYGIDAPEKMQTCDNGRGQPYACGVVSLEALKERVGSRPVRCEVKNKDQYGRNVAACSISPDLPFQQPEDMGAFLVSNGYAVAYRAYGKEYVPIEGQAQSSHKGIWAGRFTEPALWRKQQKAEALNASLASSSMDGTAGGGRTFPAAPAPPLVSSVGAGSGGKPSYAAMAAGAAAAGGGGSQQQQQQVSLSAAAGSCSGPLIKGNINSKGQKIYHTVNSGQYMRVIIEENKGERYFCTEEEAQAAGWVAAKK